MSSNRQNDSPSKRTSHYYKKKLKSSEDQKSVTQVAQKIGVKIQKRPKQAKLRARQARQRKKVYIQKLEEKIRLLQKQLKVYKQKSSAIQSSNSAFINLSKFQKTFQTQNQRKSIVKKTQSLQASEEVIKLAGIQSAFRNLYIGVQIKNEEQAQRSIDLLRKKFGVAGEQRIKWFQQLLLKIVSIMMPMHCRLLLQNCQNRQEFYNLIGCSQSMKQDRKLYFDKDTISTLCQSRPAIVDIKQQYKKIILKVVDFTQLMKQQADKLQFQIDKIENSMNPLFVGKILVDLDLQRKKTQNLNEIFPVNFYKIQLSNIKYNQEKIKTQQEEVCYKSINQEDILDRGSMISDQHYLFDLLSQ